MFNSQICVAEIFVDPPIRILELDVFQSSVHCLNIVVMTKLVLSSFNLNLIICTDLPYFSVS